jgi:DNA-binding PadR family transcriptional regulator
MGRTSTTANALLGLLGLRPSWSTYELAGQAARSLRFFWPRAESRIYAETRNLQSRGWATATDEPIGPRRSRTRYALTDQGRRELAVWLDTPPRATVIECEALLRVLLGELGSREQLLVAIGQIHTDAQDIRAVGRTVGEEYLAGTGPFQDHVHVRALVFDFLVNLTSMFDDWSHRAEKIVTGWDGQDEHARTEEALRLISEGVTRLQASR